MNRLPRITQKSGSDGLDSPGRGDKRKTASNANNDSSTRQSLIFRITYGQGNGPLLLRRTLLDAGMSEFNPQHHKESQWDLWWKSFRFRGCELAFLRSSQRVNHHPAPLGRQTDITKKDGLLRAIRHMHVTYPKCSSLLLFPTTFNLPREESRFVSTFCQRARSTRNKLCTQGRHSKEELCDGCMTEDSDEFAHQTPKETLPFRNIWILKPADMSRGRGIFVFNNLEDLVYISKSVVQKYICDILLIEGYKFDLRLYAVVPSYSPFIVYICTEGLIRFATEPYNLSDLKNVFSHLTNSSINFTGPEYLTDKAVIGRGCKWTIRQFRQWMADRNISDRFLWIRIQAIIILTLLSQASDTPKVPNAYELFGFDILVDSRLRPWLLEVNANPSMSNQCIVDEIVKKPLLNSILEMLRLNQTSVDNANNLDLPSIPLSTHAFLEKNLHMGDEPVDSIKPHQTEPYTGRERARKSEVALHLMKSFDHEFPLYGPGSEWLLPELTSLRMRFSNVLEMNTQLDKLNRTKNVSQPSLNSKSATNRPSANRQYAFSCHLPPENRLILEKSMTGHKIIPHTFGQLKLAFPFNLITRIACAKERGGYPDQRLIVQQVGRLVQYYAGWKKGTKITAADFSVVDIPAIWEDGQ